MNAQHCGVPLGQNGPSPAYGHEYILCVISILVGVDRPNEEWDMIREPVDVPVHGIEVDPQSGVGQRVGHTNFFAPALHQTTV